MQATQEQTIDIEAAVKLQIAAMRAQVQEKERKETAEEQAKIEAARKGLITALYQVMPESLQKILGITICADEYGATALFRRNGIEWQLRYTPLYNEWHISGVRIADHTSIERVTDIPSGELLTFLIRAIARTDLSAQERTRKAEERQQRIAELAGSDAQLSAIAAAKIAEWKAQQPAFEPVTLYEVLWQVAYATVGENTCAYGWTHSDLPDLSGYYIFEPDNEHPRRRVLNPHLLISSQRHTFTAIDELPDELKVKQFIEIPDMTERWSDELERAILVDAPGETYKAFAGYAPLEWLR